jgi:DNA modification methylase
MSRKPLSTVTLFRGDCVAWLEQQPPKSVHAIVTDPPYGLVEYSHDHIAKRSNGRGGIWRLPPNYDGWQRQPLPRFTALSRLQTKRIHDFFSVWAAAVERVLVPGAHIFVASTPMLSFNISGALADAGFERRGTIVRLVRTLRGGDRPKNAESEFPSVSVMPRAGWEPWLLFRKPLDGTVANTLRVWGTGALRRPSDGRPFSDVLRSSRASAVERRIAPHPSLKPQEFLRQVVRAALPLGVGRLLDPFCGSGAVNAAAAVLGYESIGIEIDKAYFKLATQAIPRLAELTVAGPESPPYEARRAKSPRRNTR